MFTHSGNCIWFVNMDNLSSQTDAVNTFALPTGSVDSNRAHNALKCLGVCLGVWRFIVFSPVTPHFYPSISWTCSFASRKNLLYLLGRPRACWPTDAIVTSCFSTLTCTQVAGHLAPHTQPWSEHLRKDHVLGKDHGDRKRSCLAGRILSTPLQVVCHLFCEVN